jgi:hypothetical protein
LLYLMYRLQLTDSRNKFQAENSLRNIVLDQWENHKS